MGILHKNIHLMLLFLKAPFLVLHFSGYTLMNFLMILSVITIYPDDTTLESRVGFWTLVWSTKHCEMGLKMVFIWLVY